jgi:hypothetical protein
MMHTLKVIKTDSGVKKVENTAKIYHIENEPFKRFIDTNDKWSQVTKNTILSDVKGLVRDYGFLDDLDKCFLLKFYIDHISIIQSTEMQAQGYRHITGSNGRARAGYQHAIQAYITFLKYQETLEPVQKIIAK